MKISSLGLALAALLCGLSCSDGIGPEGDGSGGFFAGTGGLSSSTGGSDVSSGGLSGSSGGAGSGGLSASTGGVSSSTGGAMSGTGGASETGGGSVGVSYDCDLPPAGEGGKPRPTGASANLKVLDWAGFPSALSYSFDDANSSQIAHYDEMNSWGARYTFYLQTNKSEFNDAVWEKAQMDGHEIGNHTNSHTCGAADIDSGASKIEAKFGAAPLTLAAPNGDTACQSAASKYLLVRSVSGGTIAPNGNTNTNWLPSNIPGGLGPSVGNWQIYCIHGFTGGSDGAYMPIAFDSFKTAVQQAQASGVWIDSVVKVAAYWLGQKAFPKSGSNQWTWQLPNHFPAGQCLRVTVDGGTLSQEGKPLAWDEHGYYEISLDAGSLAWSPE